MAQTTNMKIMALIDAIGKTQDPDIMKDDFETIETSLNSFPEYFNTVIKSNYRPSIIRYMYDGEAYIDAMKKLDENRRSAHIACAISVNVINRCADMYGVERPFDTGLDRDLDSNLVYDREIAAKTVFEFCVLNYLDQHVEISIDDMDKFLYDLSIERKMFKERIDINKLERR